MRGRLRHREWSGCGPCAVAYAARRRSALTGAVSRSIVGLAHTGRIRCVVPQNRSRPDALSTSGRSTPLRGCRYSASVTFTGVSCVVMSNTGEKKKAFYVLQEFYRSLESR